jgi:hypothetical protein
MTVAPMRRPRASSIRAFMHGLPNDDHSLPNNLLPDIEIHVAFVMEGHLWVIESQRGRGMNTLRTTARFVIA